MPSKFPTIGYMLALDDKRLVLTYLNGHIETLNFPLAPGAFESFAQGPQPLYFSLRAGEGIAIGYGDAESPAVFYSADTKLSSAAIYQIVNAAKAMAGID